MKCTMPQKKGPDKIVSFICSTAIANVLDYNYVVMLSDLLCLSHYIWYNVVGHRTIAINLHDTSSTF